jgi:sec-independent protein translocase protein TatA
MFGLGFWEMLLVGVIAVMLYGKRLPEVAKSFGATYRQFRRQLNDLQSQFSLDDITGSTNPYSPPKTYSDYDDRDVISAPRFEPPPMPTAEAEKSADAAPAAENTA